MKPPPHTPVSGISIPALPERHKVNELQRHAPGWIYRHRGALHPTFGLTVIAASFGFIVLEASALPVAAGTVGAMHGCRRAGDAEDDARPGALGRALRADLTPVHPQIADAAWRLRAQLPDVQFRIGELFQDRVMLDPYLLAVSGDERLLLGIRHSLRVRR